MAEKVMVYNTMLEETFGVIVDDSLYLALNVDGGQIDTEGATQTVAFYDDLAAFNAAFDDAGLLPARITPRSMTIGHPMGDKTLIIPTPFQKTNLQEWLATTAFGDNQITIKRLQDEAQNSPDLIEIS